MEDNQSIQIVRFHLLYEAKRSKKNTKIKMVVEKNLTNAIEKYGPSTRTAEHIKKLRDKKRSRPLPLILFSEKCAARSY